jgi:hypothetical protein
MASKKNKTFADQAKTIMSKYALRPNDNASKAAMDRELQALKEKQEMEREQMARDAMETLNSLGITPQVPGMMGDQMPMHQMPDGSMMPGAYHGDTTEYKNGGLWANIHAKRKRIAAGSGETMRKPGSKDAPTDEALERSKNAYGGMMDNSSMGYGGDMNEMKYGGGMCGCGKRGCKGCGGKMHKAYGGPMNSNYYANGGPMNEPPGPIRDFILGMKLRGVSKPYLGKEAFTALSSIGDYGYQGDPAVLTSMLRGKKDKVYKKGSKHNVGKAFDVSAKEDSKEFIDWINTDQGKKWMSDFGIKYLDETSAAKRKKVGSKGTAPHHHFEFKKKYKELSPDINPEKLSHIESEFDAYKEKRKYVDMSKYPGFQTQELPPVMITPQRKPITLPPEMYIPESESTKGYDIKEHPAMMYAKMREEGFDPNAHFAYGGNMRKKYFNGGFGVELNMPDIPASYGSIPKAYEIYGEPSVNKDSFDVNPQNNFTTQENLDFNKAYQDAEKTEKEGWLDKSKDPKEKTFEGKLTAGDIMGGLAQSAGDIYGLAYAMKKPAPRKRMTAEEEALDTTPYDQALARGMAAQRDISRSNPNAALQAKIAGTTALSTGLGAAKAAAQQEMEVRNIGRRMGAEQINLGQDERDIQARDARAMAISEHLKGIGDTYAGLRKDKKTMETEAYIANMLGTENYTFKKNDDGSLTIIPITGESTT